MYVILLIIQDLVFVTKNLGLALAKLGEHSITAIEWFENNYIYENELR